MEADGAFERAKDPALACGENRAPSKHPRVQGFGHPPKICNADGSARVKRARSTGVGVIG
jgi:hypothetical protein